MMSTARPTRNWRLELLAYLVAAGLVAAALLLANTDDGQPDAPAPKTPAAAPSEGVNP